MTEVTSNENGRKKGARFANVKKKSLRIDMTPMVDLGFLLITFFIFTSTISQPTSMNLIMPKDDGPAMPVKESGALTVLPTINGRVFYYEGKFIENGVLQTSLKGLRAVLLAKKRRTPEKDFFVVVKPSSVTNYQDIVDVLDELKITGVKRYAITDITKPESARIK